MILIIKLSIILGTTFQRLWQINPSFSLRFQTAVMFLGEFVCWLSSFFCWINFIFFNSKLCLIVFGIGRCYKNCQKKSQILEYPIAVNAPISVDFELDESKTWVNCEMKKKKIDQISFILEKLVYFYFTYLLWCVGDIVCWNWIIMGKCICLVNQINWLIDFFLMISSFRQVRISDHFPQKNELDYQK